jgi:hypothetical protein
VEAVAVSLVAVGDVWRDLIDGDRRRHGRRIVASGLRPDLGFHAIRAMTGDARATLIPSGKAPAGARREPDLT